MPERVLNKEIIQLPCDEKRDFKYRKRKKPLSFDRGLRLFDAWQFPTLAWGDPTLPSALRRFTSEFGMGSGGTTALKPPGKFCYSRRYLTYVTTRTNPFEQS